MTTAARELRIAHHHPGRLRLRSRAFEHDGGGRELARAKAALAAVAGVREVTSREDTGSLLVLYDPSRVGADSIVHAVVGETGLAVGVGRAKPGDEDRLAYIAIDVVRELNTLARDLTKNRADLRVLVPAALSGLGMYSLATRGARLPSWDTLLYWSYAVFLSVNQREIGERAHAKVEAR